MEPTSEPDNSRQSRGLARFWPVHGMPAPAQRQSEEDLDAPDGAATAHASDQLAGVAGPTGEHPQVSDQQSQPQDDQQGPDELAQSPFAPARPHPALTNDTQMVALGSRRPADALLGGVNGARWNNQGGFPPVETNGHRNGDLGPRHGGAPIANGQPPAANGAQSAPRSPFAPSSDGGPASPFAPPPFPQQAHGSATVNGGNAEPPAAAPHPLAPAAPHSLGPAEPHPLSPAEPHSLGPAAPHSLAPAAPHSLAPAAPHPLAPQEPPAALPAPAPEQLEPPVARTVSAPPAAESAPAPIPMTSRPVSAQPVSGQPAAERPQVARSVPHPLNVDPAVPTRLEPSGWATPSPRAAAASGSAAVPVSAPHGGQPHSGQPGDGVSNGGMSISSVPSGGVTSGGVTGGRRNRDDEAADGPRTPVQRRSTSLDDAREMPGGRRAARAAEPNGVDAPLRPGDVHESPITFWDEAAVEQFRSEWHEVKAQFVDDPVAALTRAHDLLTEAVHELTESMLAERDELDPLRGTATPDTESMRMAMRGYREFLDRILTL
jgi:hypothetical protein